MSGEYSIGTARRVITPLLGSQMAGFDARKGTSTGVHDDLHARALVFANNGIVAAIVSLEVIAVSREFSLATRLLIQEQIGIPAANVIISATHTHCGPATLNHFFNQGQPIDEVYMSSVAHAVCEAVGAAKEALSPRRLRSGFALCDGIAVNRRTADGKPVDPLVGVLLAEELDGTPYAVAVNFACHTTVLGPNTLEFTGDFPAYTLDKLRSELGVEAIYFNGAEGDLSIGHKSDLSAVGVIDPYRTFATAKRLGEKLADAVLQGISALVEETEELVVSRTSVGLPLKPQAPHAAASQTRIEAGLALEAVQWMPLVEQVPYKQKSLFARIEEYYAQLYEEDPAEPPKVLNVELAAIALGRTVLLSLPGEIFVNVALGIRKHSVYPRLFFLGLADDYIGYLPSEGADASGYEVVASRVTGEAWRDLESAAIALLTRMLEGHEGVQV